MTDITEPITCLDELFHRITRCLTVSSVTVFPNDVTRQNEGEESGVLKWHSQCLERLGKLLESYRGTDWVKHTTIPQVKRYGCFGYSRVQVRSQPDLFSLLILTWAPWSSSVIHSHPCRRCFLMPLQGNLMEHLYGVDEANNQFERLKTTPLEINSAYWIDDSQGWHSIENRSSGLGVSLHVYVPAFVRWVLSFGVLSPIALRTVLIVRCKIIDPATQTVTWANCFPKAKLELPLHKRILNFATEYLGDHPHTSKAVIRFRTEDDISSIFTTSSCPIEFNKGSGPVSDDVVMDAVVNTCDYSTQTGHLFFFNQLFGRPDDIAVAADCLATCVNGNMMDAETAPVFVLMERRLLEHMAYFLDWHTHKPPTEKPKVKTFDGILTPGASVGNLVALSLALDQRKKASRGARQEYVVFTSDHGHGSVETAVTVTGVGLENLTYVPVCSEGWRNGRRTTMCGASLRASVNEVKKSGRVPLFVNATAGTTLSGDFDMFEEIREVCDEEEMWLHVDGALGASFLLLQEEEPYTSLVKGMKTCDSLTWNLHKLCGVSLQCSALLTRHPEALRNLTSPTLTTRPTCSSQRSHFNKFLTKTDSSTGQHLSDQVGGPRLQFGRRCDAFKAWLLWKKLGDVGMANRPRLAYTHAQWLGLLITSFPAHSNKVRGQVSEMSGGASCSSVEGSTTGQFGGGESGRETPQRAEPGPPNINSMTSTPPSSLSGASSLHRSTQEKKPLMQRFGSEVSEVSAASFPRSWASMEGEEGEGPLLINKDHGAFRLVWQPVSVNCCFWWIPFDLRSIMSDLLDRPVSPHANPPATLPLVSGCASHEDLSLVFKGESNLFDALEYCCVKMKRMMLQRGSVLVDYHYLNTPSSNSSQPSPPPFWRVPMVNPDISKDDLSHVLLIINEVSKHSLR
eukprot:GHVN01006268.1.p1 GENE.GHVN01006268.1~~GHVN01006268.1.p1  ORF type:complete len:909 (+),score=125.59 GHVN01006268.1:112-2838(+)